MEHKKCCLSSKFQTQASGSHIQKQNLSAVPKLQENLRNKRAFNRISFAGHKMKMKRKMNLQQQLQ